VGGLGRVLLAGLFLSWFPSVASAAVPTNTAPPAVSGIPVDGQTLSVTAGVWTPAPTAYAYQWFDCDAMAIHCRPIPGATAATYTLTPADVGSAIVVLETASNASGPGSPVFSAPTSLVAVRPPSTTTPPTITGSPVPGQTLTEAHGGWTGSPTAFAVQWVACDLAGNACVIIAGATAATYTVTGDDIGHTIRVVETAANAGGPSEPAVSAPTAVVSVPPHNTAPPEITGSAHVGGTLGCSTGAWTGTVPITYAYRWSGDGVTIAGASASTYTAGPGDVATALICTVTAANRAGSASAQSRAVLVTAAPACFQLAGSPLGRCRARVAYDAARAKCGTISIKTKAGHKRRTACVAKAKLTYKRALAVVKCQSIKSSHGRAACVARAHKIKK
jgi:hypothetical protein